MGSRILVFFGRVFVLGALAFSGCMSGRPTPAEQQANERRFNWVCEQKYGPPVANLVQEAEKVLPDFEIKVLPKRHPHPQRADFVGKWTCTTSSQRLNYRKSPEDGLWRRHDYDHISSRMTQILGRVRSGSITCTLSSDGTFMRDVGMRTVSRGTGETGTWTFKDGVVRLTFRSAANVLLAFLLEDGTVEMRWEDVEKRAKSLGVARTFYDKAGCQRDLTIDPTTASITIHAPWVHVCADELNRKQAKEQDRRLHMRENFSALKEQGIITDEEFGVEMRKLEGVGK